MCYATSFPEFGRWGSGPAWDAAEDVFRADSAAVLDQLRHGVGVRRQALIAANITAIATAFVGSVVAGTQWLIDNLPAAPPGRVERAALVEAVRVADPTGEWSALRAAPGGVAMTASWAPRAEAITAYRALFPGDHTRGIDSDAVLMSLLHAHYVRAYAVDFDDEAICRYLARAAAKAWQARTSGIAS
jgi:thiopeptide-type bacteriocin biosynthesis protein